MVTAGGRALFLTRVVGAARPRVFHAWTDPALLARWMLGPEGWRMAACEVDLRVGGAWRFEWRQSGGAAMERRGVYLEVAPPGRLAYTESGGGECPETVDKLVLSDEGGKTSVTLRILYSTPQARDAALAAGMTKGIALNFERLDALLSSETARWAQRTASGQ